MYQTWNGVYLTSQITSELLSDIMSVSKNQQTKTLLSHQAHFLLHIFPPGPWSTWDIFVKRLEKDENFEGCDIYFFIKSFFDDVIFMSSFVGSFLSVFLYSFITAYLINLSTVLICRLIPAILLFFCVNSPFKPRRKNHLLSVIYWLPWLLGILTMVDHNPNTLG